MHHKIQRCYAVPQLDGRTLIMANEAMIGADFEAAFKLRRQGYVGRPSLPEHADRGVRLRAQPHGGEPVVAIR